MKQVGDLPGCHARQKTLTTDRLANLESIRFIEPDISANLCVKSRNSKRLNARAVEKHIPTVEFFGRRDQCERRASQLRCTALRVGDEESRQ